MPVKKPASSRGKTPNKRRSSKSPTKTRSKSSRPPKKSSKKGRRKIQTPSRPPIIDPFSKCAMENAYMICHTAEHFLSVRGFAYSGTLCKGGKKGGSAKKKKKP